MIDGILLIWYLLTAGSLVFLIWDLQTNTPITWVMKVAWVLIVLYTGPVGLVIFLLSCRQPLPGTHEAFIAPHWKQSIGSLMHCVAGDATGIILAAVATYSLHLPNGIDLTIEYLSGFLVGLFVFQSLFKVLMTGERYLSAVRHSFFAETVSMNMVMTGMLPVKAVLMHLQSGADDPTKPEFWGIMSLATMVGMIVAYPINAWMVGRGLKHGMMSATASAATRGATPDITPQTGRKPEMRSGELPLPLAAGIVVGTAAILIAAIWLTSRFIPLRFS